MRLSEDLGRRPTTTVLPWEHQVKSKFKVVKTFYDYTSSFNLPKGVSEPFRSLPCLPWMSEVFLAHSNTRDSTRGKPEYPAAQNIQFN